MSHLRFSFLMRLIIILVLGAGLGKELVMIFQTENEASTLATEAAVKAGTDSRTQALRSLKASGAEDVARLDKAVVTKIKLASVISEIEDAGKALGLVVNISSISGGTVTASTTAASVIKISIDTRGSWAANLGFVNLLENLPYKVSVDQAQLNLTDKGWQGSDLLTLTALPQ